MPIKQEYLSLLIAAFGFVSVFLYCLLIYQLFRQRAAKKKLVDKIRQHSPGTGTGEGDRQSGEMGQWSQMLHFLIRLGRRVGPPDNPANYARTRLKFLKAGLSGENTQWVFWGVKCLLAITMVVGFLLLRFAVFKSLTPLHTLLVCNVLALLGFYLPDIWLHIRIGKRKERILKGLPDALDLLVLCVEGGMGLDQAIGRIAEELKLSNTILSDELKFFNLELRAGLLRRDALRNLARRIDLEDVNSLVAVLIQTEKFGTSLGPALRVYSDLMRKRRIQKAEEIAAKVPVKLTVIMIFLIFPALFVVIMGPALLQVLQVIANR